MNAYFLVMNSKRCNLESGFINGSLISVSKFTGFAEVDETRPVYDETGVCAGVLNAIRAREVHGEENLLQVRDCPLLVN